MRFYAPSDLFFIPTEFQQINLNFYFFEFLAPRHPTSSQFELFNLKNQNFVKKDVGKNSIFAV